MRRTKFQGIVKQVWAADGDRVYLAAFGDVEPVPIALRLYASRVAADITRSAMAVCLRVHPTSVTRWETGVFHTISMKHLTMWALVCGVDPDWLVHGTGEVPYKVRKLCFQNQRAFREMLEPLPDSLGVPSTPAQFMKYLNEYQGRM